MIKRLKRNCLLTVILFLAFVSIDNVYGQFIDDDLYTKRHFYGFNIGVDLGLINQFEGSPLIGYRITPRIHAGVGGKYQYYYDKRVGNVFKGHIFGPLVFTDIIAIRSLDELMPFRFIDGSVVLHAEMNYLNLPTEYFAMPDEHPGSKRFFRPTWLAGAGLQRKAGSESFLQIMLMFDFSDHSPRVYSNPVLRFGFLF